GRERGAGGYAGRRERGEGFAIGIGRGDVHGQEVVLRDGGGGGGRDHRRAIRIRDGDGGGARSGERVPGGERDAVAPGLGEVGRPRQRSAAVAHTGTEPGAGGHAGRRERGEGFAIRIGRGDVHGQEVAFAHG